LKALRKTVTIMELIMKMVIAFIKKNKFDEVMLVSEKRWDSLRHGSHRVFGGPYIVMAG